MTDYSCKADACDRPVRDATICGACAALLTRDLSDVQAFATELDVTLTRQARSEERQGGRSAEKPMPYDVGASEALAVLRSTLVAWVRLCAEEDDLAHPGDSLAELADFLLSEVEFLRKHQAGAEALDEIGSAVEMARRTVDRKAERLFAGPCDGRGATFRGPEAGGDGCADWLYARPGARDVSCRTCHTIYDAYQRRTDMLEAAWDQLAPASLLAAAVSRLGQPVTADRIRQWATRKRITAHGWDGKRPTYRVGDVLTIMDEEARKAS